MPKNMTLRGLALGAIAAIAASGLVAAPAHAVGIEGDFVSLAPSTGTEYTVLAGTNAKFTLSANEASTLVTGDLKFLVTDASGVIEPGNGTSGRSVAVAADASVSATVASSLNISSSAITTNVGAGSLVEFSANLVSTTSVVVATASTKVYSVSTSSTANNLVVSGTGNAGALDAKAQSAFNVIVLREARDTVKNQYVVDTGNSETTTSSTLELVSPDTESRTVTVVAWKDANDDNKIDSTEYVSATRTVKFIKPSELVVTTAMAVVPGDATLSAEIKTEPVLNGNQVLTNDSKAINVAFTRQDSSATLFGKGNGTTPATWNDTTKAFTVLISNEVGTSIGWAGYSAAGANQVWTGLTAPAGSGTSKSNAVKTSGSGTVTVTLIADENPHSLRVGDKVTFDGTNAPSLLQSVELSVASVPASNSFTVAAGTTSGEIVLGTSSRADFTVTTYDDAPTALNTLVDRALPGTYTAQTYVQGAAAGTKVTTTAVSATSAAVEMETIASASVMGGNSTDTTSALVKKGTLTVPVTITVTDEDEAAVSAGRPVVVTFAGSGADTYKINGKTGSQTLTTDANGQVVLSVTAAAGAVGYVDITATAENSATVDHRLQWVAQAYGLVDFTQTGDSALDASVVRSIVAGGSYTLNLAVMDQWFAPAADASYRLVVTGSGTVEGVKTLSAGRATVTIADNGFQTAIATTVTLQKDVSGTWTAQGEWVLTTNVVKTPGIVLGADATSLYGVTVDTADLVAKKALVELDKRLSSAAVPAYTNDVVLAGQVRNAGTSAGYQGAEVVVTGPSNVLFFNGNVYKRGSITVLTDSNGNFNVTLYSTTAQTDSVISFASLGVTGTAKVSFSGIGVGEGTALAITAPDNVAPASTLQIKAKLTDAYGNAVQASAGRIKMTYTGAGIGFGTLPDATDKNGELSYSVLLGAGDTGTITVVVSYDQNGDGDFVDAKDLNTTKTITVGAAAPVASSDAKVNAGSFKGYVALYAKGYEGQKMTAKVAGKWLKVDSLASGFERVVRYTGAGYDIVVEIYIDGELEGTFNLTTK